MELRQGSSILDYLEISDPGQHYFSMEDLSTSSLNALRRSMISIDAWTVSNSREIEDKCSRPIPLVELASLTIADLKDLRQVGETKILQLIFELRQSVIGLDGYIQNPIATMDHKMGSISMTEVEIEKAATLEELTQAMVEHLKLEFELHGIRDTRRLIQIDFRTEEIWKNRLPWLSENPKTLEALGKYFDITRERVRQIQNLAHRYPFSKNLQVNLLLQIQELLLESSSLEDFKSSLIEEGLTLSKDYSIGKIRYLALEFGYSEIASDIEKSIYRWANRTF